MRRRIYIATPFKGIRRGLIGLLETTATHDEIYDAEYYVDTVDPAMTVSAHTIANSIVGDLSPRSVVDIGCGAGLLLLALKERGVSCVGIDYADAALDICRMRGLTVVKYDLEGRAPLNLMADVVVSTEVAEHLPASCSDRFVDQLCMISKIAVVTAAEPGVAGTNHVNERPNEYWIGKFAARGFKFAEALSVQWRNDWKRKNVAGCYANTVMIFQRESEAGNRLGSGTRDS